MAFVFAESPRKIICHILLKGFTIEFPHLHELSKAVDRALQSNHQLELPLVRLHLGFGVFSPILKTVLAVFIVLLPLGYVRHDGYRRDDPQGTKSDK